MILIHLILNHQNLKKEQLELMVCYLELTELLFGQEELIKYLWKKWKEKSMLQHMLLWSNLVYK